MRKTISTLLLITCLPGIALAGAQMSNQHTPHMSESKYPNAGQHHFGKKQNMMTGLHLSAEQHQQISKIMSERMRTRHDITQKYLNKLSETDRNALNLELKTSKENSDKALRNILTAEQQKQFDDMKQKRENHKQEWTEFQEWKKAQKK